MIKQQFSPAFFNINFPNTTEDAAVEIIKGVINYKINEYMSIEKMAGYTAKGLKTLFTYYAPLALTGTGYGIYNTVKKIIKPSIALSVIEKKKNTGIDDRTDEEKQIDMRKDPKWINKAENDIKRALNDPEVMALYRELGIEVKPFYIKKNESDFGVNNTTLKQTVDNYSKMKEIERPEIVKRSIWTYVTGKKNKTATESDKLAIEMSEILNRLNYKIDDLTKVVKDQAMEIEALPRKNEKIVHTTAGLQSKILDVVSMMISKGVITHSNIQGTTIWKAVAATLGISFSDLFTIGRFPEIIPHVVQMINSNVTTGRTGRTVTVGDNNTGQVQIVFDHGTATISGQSGGRKQIIDDIINNQIPNNVAQTIAQTIPVGVPIAEKIKQYTTVSQGIPVQTKIEIMVDDIVKKKTGLSETEKFSFKTKLMDVMNKYAFGGIRTTKQENDLIRATMEINQLYGVDVNGHLNYMRGNAGAYLDSIIRSSIDPSRIVANSVIKQGYDYVSSIIDPNKKPVLKDLTPEQANELSQVQGLYRDQYFNQQPAKLNDDFITEISTNVYNNLLDVGLRMHSWDYITGTPASRDAAVRAVRQRQSLYWQGLEMPKTEYEIQQIRRMSNAAVQYAVNFTVGTVVNSALNYVGLQISSWLNGNERIVKGNEVVNNLEKPSAVDIMELNDFFSKGNGLVIGGEVIQPPSGRGKEVLVVGDKINRNSVIGPVGKMSTESFVKEFTKNLNKRYPPGSEALKQFENMIKNPPKPKLMPGDYNRNVIWHGNPDGSHKHVDTDLMSDKPLPSVLHQFEEPSYFQQITNYFSRREEQPVKSMNIVENVSKIRSSFDSNSMLFPPQCLSNPIILTNNVSNDMKKRIEKEKRSDPFKKIIKKNLTFTEKQSLIVKRTFYRDEKPTKSLFMTAAGMYMEGITRNYMKWLPGSSLFNYFGYDEGVKIIIEMMSSVLKLVGLDSVFLWIYYKSMYIVAEMTGSISFFDKLIGIITSIIIQGKSNKVSTRDVYESVCDLIRRYKNMINNKTLVGSDEIFNKIKLSVETGDKKLASIITKIEPMYYFKKYENEEWSKKTMENLRYWMQSNEGMSMWRVVAMNTADSYITIWHNKILNHDIILFAREKADFMKYTNNVLNNYLNSSTSKRLVTGMFAAYLMEAKPHIDDPDSKFVTMLWDHRDIVTWYTMLAKNIKTFFTFLNTEQAGSVLVREKKIKLIQGLRSKYSDDIMDNFMTQVVTLIDFAMLVQVTMLTLSKSRNVGGVQYESGQKLYSDFYKEKTIIREKEKPWEFNERKLKLQLTWFDDEKNPLPTALKETVALNKSRVIVYGVYEEDSPFYDIATRNLMESFQALSDAIELIFLEIQGMGIYSFEYIPSRKIESNVKLIFERDMTPFISAPSVMLELMDESYLNQNLSLLEDSDASIISKIIGTFVNDTFLPMYKQYMKPTVDLTINKTKNFADQTKSMFDLLAKEAQITPEMRAAEKKKFEEAAKKDEENKKREKNPQLIVQEIEMHKKETENLKIEIETKSRVENIKKGGFNAIDNEITEKDWFEVRNTKYLGKARRPDKILKNNNLLNNVIKTYSVTRIKKQREERKKTSIIDSTKIYSLHKILGNKIEEEKNDDEFPALSNDVKHRVRDVRPNKTLIGSTGLTFNCTMSHQKFLMNKTVVRNEEVYGGLIVFNFHGKIDADDISNTLNVCFSGLTIDWQGSEFIVKIDDVAPKCLWGREDFTNISTAMICLPGIKYWEKIDLQSKYKKYNWSLRVSENLNGLKLFFSKDVLNIDFDDVFDCLTTYIVIRALFIHILAIWSDKATPILLNKYMTFDEKDNLCHIFYMIENYGYAATFKRIRNIIRTYNEKDYADKLPFVCEEMVNAVSGEYFIRILSRIVFNHMISVRAQEQKMFDHYFACFSPDDSLPKKSAVYTLPTLKRLPILYALYVSDQENVHISNRFSQGSHMFLLTDTSWKYSLINDLLSIFDNGIHDEGDRHNTEMNDSFVKWANSLGKLEANLSKYIQKTHIYRSTKQKLTTSIEMRFFNPIVKYIENYTLLQQYKANLLMSLSFSGHVKINDKDTDPLEVRLRNLTIYNGEFINTLFKDCKFQIDKMFIKELDTDRTMMRNPKVYERIKDVYYHTLIASGYHTSINPSISNRLFFIPPQKYDSFKNELLKGELIYPNGIIRLQIKLKKNELRTYIDHTYDDNLRKHY